MSFYYAGFNTSTLFSKDGDITFAVDSFTKISEIPGITDFQIGWGYFLFWKEKELYVVKRTEEDCTDSNINTHLIQIPGTIIDSCKQAAIGKDNIIILSDDNKIWQYKIYENSWKKVINFMSVNSDSQNEYPVKILQEGCTVVLTNLGRVYNVPTLVEMPKRVQFVDVACGFDHTILLAQNGDIYSLGMGTRGQLGHSDLEDCDNPKLIEALAGIKVTEISAAGSHSAVITEQGDLYTWGWNTNGELGLPNQESKVVAVPTLVDFTDDRNKNIETVVKKVECGNNFTICMMDDGTLWGSGCNKYGQLGQLRESLTSTSKFVKLNVSLDSEEIVNFKCREWGTVLITK